MKSLQIFSTVKDLLELKSHRVREQLVFALNLSSCVKAHWARNGDKIGANIISSATEIECCYELKF